MEQYLKRNNCRLYVRMEGEGPVLLLIHGVACDCDFYSAASAVLSKHFKVITYDRRGYSRSRYSEDYEEKAADASIAEQAEDARAIMEMAMRGERTPVTAVGCSAGGIIALELARKYPEDINRLFIYETPYAVTKEDLKGIKDWKMKLKEAADKNRMAKAMLLLMEAMGPADEKALPVSSEMFQRNMDNLGRFLKTEISEILDYSEKTPGIRPEMPVFCACGENDRGTRFYHMTHEAARYWGTECIDIKGSHNLALDRPEAFAGWIIEKSGADA